MLARVGSVDMPRPGGDVIGRRRVDTHFLALNQLGAAVCTDSGFRGWQPAGWGGGHSAGRGQRDGYGECDYGRRARQGHDITAQCGL